MTDLLDKAIASARGMPPDTQDETARMVLAFVGDDPSIYHLTPEEEAEQVVANAEEARGDYASDADVQAIWTKHGLRDCALPELRRGCSTSCRPRLRSSPSGARNARERIKAALHPLLKYPYAGQATGRRSIRRLLVSPYPHVLTYRVGDDEIVIRSVRHAARRPLA